MAQRETEELGPLLERLRDYTGASRIVVDAKELGDVGALPDLVSLTSRCLVIVEHDGAAAADRRLARAPTVRELYNQARALGVPGRSRMSRAQLEAAVAAAASSGGR